MDDLHLTPYAVFAMYALGVLSGRHKICIANTNMPVRTVVFKKAELFFVLFLSNVRVCFLLAVLRALRLLSLWCVNIAGLWQCVRRCEL